MMLSVLVWLAMQGQVQKPWDNPIYDDPGIVQPLTCNYCGQYVSPVPVCTAKITDNCISPDGNTLYGCRSDHDCAKKPKPKPAEHVIEIKTRRSEQGCLDGTGQMSPSVMSITPLPTNAGKACKCNAGFEVKLGGWSDSCDRSSYLCSGAAVFTQDKCERITRELWIDGQKFGVIKGLE